MMDSRLYKYAKIGDVHSLQQLLDEDSSILLKLTPRENTALHIAVQFRNINVAAEIYRRCKSLLTLPNSDGDTPLHLAARSGDFSIVKFLVGEVLSSCEGLGMRNRENNTVLHEALRNGNQEVVRFLIRVEPKLACFENYAGESPLYMAAREAMVEIVYYILMTTPSSAHGGSDGQTALHVAVIEKHYDIMEALLSFKMQLIKEVDNHGRTPLYHAASIGDRKIVQRLLQIDTYNSIVYMSDKDGYSPIHIAACKGHSNVIEEIIQHCPDAGELTDFFGWSSLHVAIFHGQAKVVRYILKAKELEVLINQPDIDGNTPLHLATMERKTWIARYLMLDRRVNRRAKNQIGQTALDIDGSSRDSRVKAPRNKLYQCKILEEAIPPTHSYEKTGQTLLMVATLITTITFSAAFTMPGGFNNNSGPNQGKVLLESNKPLRMFIVSDTIAMACSMTAACLLFWGAVSAKKFYIYYFTSASLLTYFSLQSTAVAFMTAMRAVTNDLGAVWNILDYLVGGIFHLSTCMLLAHLVQKFSFVEVYWFLVSYISRFWSKIIEK